MTINEALSIGTKKIGRRDAGLLLSHVTGFNESEFFLRGSEEFSATEKYFSFLERRTSGEPTQYIIGKWEFMGLPFVVDKRALIPRPETELLVEEVLRCAKGRNAVRVLDVCTGSGCIALAIAHFAKNCEVTASDISPDALSLAKENADALGLSVQFILSDLMDSVHGNFDIIVSNPPYITHDEMTKLSPSVRDFEPVLALNGGADGLDFYRRLVPQSKNALNSGGFLFLEIGKTAVADLMKNTGFKDIKISRDYAGIERIVVGNV